MRKIYDEKKNLSWESSTPRAHSCWLLSDPTIKILCLPKSSTDAGWASFIIPALRTVEGGATKHCCNRLHEVHKGRDLCPSQPKAKVAIRSLQRLNMDFRVLPFVQWVES